MERHGSIIDLPRPLTLEELLPFRYDPTVNFDGLVHIEILKHLQLLVKELEACRSLLVQQRGEAR